MPVFDITAPDGTKYTVTGPDGSTEHDALAQVMKAHAAVQPAPDGAQPSTWDKIVGSPIGRFAQDNIVAPVESVAQGVAKVIGGPSPTPAAEPLMSPVRALLDKAVTAEAAGYQGSLARNRNTPGYAAARATADQTVANRGGSGLGDQLLPQLLPSLAGAMGAPGGIDSMNANADAQSAGQDAYRTAHPILSTIANLGGGLLLAPERAALPALAVPASKAVPTVADLKKLADAAYKTVDNSGIVVSGPSFDNMVSGLQTKLGKLGIDPDLHPDATAVLNRMNALRSTSAGGAGRNVTADIPFQQVNMLRELAGDAAGAQIPRDAMRGGLIQDHIDNFVDNLTHADTVGGVDPTTTTNMLNTARDFWARAKSAETLQGVVSDAQLNAGKGASLEQSLRNGFASLAKNDRQMARLTPDVQAAVKQVVNGGPVANILRLAGKFAPRGVISTALSTGIGAGIGGVPGAMALPLLGEVGRAGATAITKAAAQRAVDLAALGRGGAAPVAPVFQLPALTAQSQAPYGLISPALRLPQLQTQ